MEEHMEDNQTPTAPTLLTEAEFSALLTGKVICTTALSQDPSGPRSVRVTDLVRAAGQFVLAERVATFSRGRFSVSYQSTPVTPLQAQRFLAARHAELAAGPMPDPTPARPPRSPKTG